MYYEDSQYRNDIQMYLEKIQDRTDLICSTLAESSCCILTDFEQLHSLVSEAQGLASSYYLQSFLSPYTKEFSNISLAAHRLSESRHGALMVVERKQPLDDWIHNGFSINAKISHTLLETIFYPGNPMHDGGTLIRKDTIVSAGNILPLTEKKVEGIKLGTRHRAAIGLTEQTDAIVIVVSEETGRITFAVDGKLYVVKTN
ncbi:sporulation-specific diadenylate cyclase CdaS [Cytobacillus spongiae]|jgi:uncharacterized protein (TIGR00159 family)|uniref:sporulation-specific diadenylate cyclase CdaS n=1 Tax=Cytobacillus spongiae TaxID=2901381 RepID=UPI001F2D3D55|nr:sporulation-specific diadenylate cyclase CdaS [Cytobacillus spongiae]UII54370.1 sporulation-specific diadenylate cyclase CdaS [Cytobacillus spongiae]